MCQRLNAQNAANDSGPATRKPIRSWEGSRDVPDVLTLTDVTSRLPSEVAETVEMSCPTVASSQGVAILGVEKSCPTEASSQDVLPVVSTNKANQLVLCDGTTRVDRSKLVKDTGLSTDGDGLVYSNVLEWKPNSRGELPVNGFPHHLDDGGYRSDGTGAMAEFPAPVQSGGLNPMICRTTQWVEHEGCHTRHLTRCV